MVSVFQRSSIVVRTCASMNMNVDAPDDCKPYTSTRLPVPAEVVAELSVAGAGVAAPVELGGGDAGWAAGVGGATDAPCEIAAITTGGITVLDSTGSTL